MLPSGRAVRLNTYIDIPLEIGLPHFIRDDNADDDVPQFHNFKLSLQSVVCHRGVSVDAGHYIALVRSRPDSHPISAGHRPPNDVSNGSSPRTEDEWLRFDDLAYQRVTRIDIHKALRDESPYLLFYQVQPTNEAAVRGSLESPPPPPYTASNQGGPTNSTVPTPTMEPAPTTVTGDQSQRTSVDLLRTTDEQPRTSNSSDARLSFSLPSNGERPRSSRHGSFIGNDADRGPPPPSKTGSSEEGRLSSTFSRLTARMSRDKLRTMDSGALGTTTDGDVNGATAEGSRKGKIRGKSRARGGGDAEASPERECLVM